MDSRSDASRAPVIAIKARAKLGPSRHINSYTQSSIVVRTHPQKSISIHQLPAPIVILMQRDGQSHQPRVAITHPKLLAPS